MSVKWKKIEPYDGLDKILYETFTHKLRLGYAEFGEKKTVMSIHFANIVEKCQNFEVKDTDIFVASYPKTGTTWCQEMIWMIMNNLDFKRGKQLIDERFPFFEWTGQYTYEKIIENDPSFKLNPTILDSVKYIDELKDANRLIKTHLPWDLLPKQIRNKEKMPKIIYVTRNAKDTCTSYYYHCVLREGYSGDFETFCNLFLSGKLCFGNLCNHVTSYWENRNENILFITYENMKQNLPAVIKKVALFLNKILTEEQITMLVEHLSFESMKNNPAVNYSNVPNRKFFDNNADGIKFYRSGTVGSYKQVISPTMEQRFDKWYDENVISRGIKFDN